MKGYFFYYLVWVFVVYALRAPWLLAGLVVLLALRRFIPDPGPLLRLLSRARSLRAQIEINRANVPARRELAAIYVEGKRARAALTLLREGLERSPDEPELLYLLGLALHRTGRHEEALDPLVRAVGNSPNVRYGLPYLVAGDALAALKRWEEALDAYERYLRFGGSDVGGHTRLARAHARLGDERAAREALAEAIRTWRVLPASMKRRQFGRYLGAQWARVAVLREPVAILSLMAGTGLLILAAWFVVVPVVGWLASARSLATPIGAYPRRGALHDGVRRCGSQSTGSFAGRYEVLLDSPVLAMDTEGRSAEQVETSRRLAQFARDWYANFEIGPDRIRSGTSLVQEFCLTTVLESTPQSLRAEAVWHEDIHDPGDASMVALTLTREGDVTTFRFWPLGTPPGHAAEIRLAVRSARAPNGSPTAIAPRK